MSGTGTSSPTGLRRAVTGPLLFLFILGDVLGAGVYALIGEIAGDAGGLVWLSFGVALGLALLTAFSYAELVTKYPRAGGSAVYAEKAYRSPLVAFLVGYCMFAAGVVSAAGLSLAFTGEYLTAFLPVPQVPAAIVFLLVVALVNATVVLLLLFVFLSTNVAALVLRRDTAAHDHFRSPSAMPVLAVLSCLLLLTQQELRHWALAGVLLAPAGPGPRGPRRLSDAVTRARRPPRARP